jgi:hypothetical protein
VRWCLSHRADGLAREIADRHYNRQKPGTPQFVPPGRCMTLLADDGGALWVTSWPFAQYVKHQWGGAWVNSCYRRETTQEKSSVLIRQAVAATRWFFGEPPALGIVTFVDANEVERKREPGYCYKKAGFKHVGFTKAGLWAWQLMPADMPEPSMPLPYAGPLFRGVALISTFAK